ncbi:MAG: GIY-YIG nuclease family protein [Ruminococcus sp.]|nr:GIY-YIG nuclease family protein [Ruminococcus sp.]
MSREAAERPEKEYYVYILRCRDDSLYIGITSDLSARMKAHCGKRPGGAKYTRSHPAAALEAAWKAENKSAAARMEYALKKLPRSKKLLLIGEPERLCTDYVPQLEEYMYIPCSRELLEECFADRMEENM